MTFQSLREVYQFMSVSYLYLLTIFPPNFQPTHLQVEKEIQNSGNMFKWQPPTSA